LGLRRGPVGVGDLLHGENALHGIEPDHDAAERQFGRILEGLGGSEGLIWKFLENFYGLDLVEEERNGREEGKKREDV